MILYRVPSANPGRCAFRSRGRRDRRAEDAQVLPVRGLSEHRVPDGVHQRGDENPHLADHQGPDIGLVHGQGTWWDLRQGKRYYGPPARGPRVVRSNGAIRLSRRSDENVLAGATGEQAAAEPGAAAADQPGRAGTGMGTERGRGAGHRGTERGLRRGRRRGRDAVHRGPDKDLFTGHVPGGGPALHIPFTG